MSPRRLLTAVLAVALLGGLCAQASRLGAAGAIAFDSYVTLDSPAPLSTSTLVALREGLTRSAAADPRDPGVHEMLGIVELRTEGPSASAGEFGRALALRPVAPVTWGNIAVERYRAGLTGDGVFQAALANAVRLGPNEPAVQAVVADSGLAVWGELAPDRRRMIEGVVAAGMRRNARQFLQIAERRGRLDVACRHFESPPRQAEAKWTQTCQGMEATS